MEKIVAELVNHEGKLNDNVGTVVDFKLPEYATDGSIGIDLYVKETTIIPANPIFIAALNTHNYLKDALTILLDEFGNVTSPRVLEKFDNLLRSMKDESYTKVLTRTLVPLNIKIDYAACDGKKKWGLLVPRSSLFKAKNLMQSNSVGIIDTDFCSEHMLPVINMSANDVELQAGERIAQLIFFDQNQVQLIKGIVARHENHNGHGSTDGYKK